MSRNFGIGSRDMGRAGQMALDRAATAGGVSFSTAATNADRWNDFTSWAREQGIKRMEDVTPEAVRDYGLQLATRVEDGQLAASTAQNRVSAVNSVMGMATRGEWRSVSPTRSAAFRSAALSVRTRLARWIAPPTARPWPLCGAGWRACGGHGGNLRASWACGQRRHHYSMPDLHSMKLSSGGP